MLRDIQNEEDTRGKHLYKVGVSGIRVPISIKQATDKKATPTVARVSIYTSLDEKHKGANMSRYSEVLHDALEGHIGSEVIITMLDELKKRLGSENSYVKFKFDYFMEKAAPVSRKKSYMVYTCDLEGKSKNGKNKLYLTVRVPYTSLCPCSQAISDNGAHNQRSEAKITIELREKYLDIREIIQMVECYLSDSEYFESQENYVNSYGCLNYAHGWLDTGARLKIFNVKDNRLFTV